MREIWFDAQDSPPLSVRLYARLPLAPIWIGTLIAVGYLCCVVAYFSALGAPGGLVPGEVSPSLRNFWQIPGWWTLIVNAVMIGFAPTVMVYTLQSVEQDVRDLAPALGADPEAVEAEIRRVARLNPRTLLRVGLASAAVMIAFSYLDPGLWSARERPSARDPALLWFVGQQVLMGWLWSRAVVADMTTARAFSGLAERVRDVDLLDLRPLGAFARRGVRSVLYWMVGLAFFSLFWLGPNAGDANVVPFVMLIALAGGNLVLLLRAGRQRIRAEKESQLARIREAIRTDQAALLESTPGAQEAATRLPALFAAEARVESARDLAFDATTAFRFALYVTLGVGSWIGGALIERLLGAALD